MVRLLPTLFWTTFSLKQNHKKAIPCIFSTANYMHLEIVFVNEKTIVCTMVFLWGVEDIRAVCNM